MVEFTVVNRRVHSARDWYQLRPARPMPSGRAQAASSLTSCWSDPWDQALFCHGRGGVLRHRGSSPGTSHLSDPLAPPGVSGGGRRWHHQVSVGRAVWDPPSWISGCLWQFLVAVRGLDSTNWLGRGLLGAVPCGSQRGCWVAPPGVIATVQGRSS